MKSRKTPSRRGSRKRSPVRLTQKRPPSAGKLRGAGTPNRALPAPIGLWALSRLLGTLMGEEFKYVDFMACEIACQSGVFQVTGDKTRLPRFESPLWRPAESEDPKKPILLRPPAVGIRYKGRLLREGAGAAWDATIYALSFYLTAPLLIKQLECVEGCLEGEEDWGSVGLSLMELFPLGLFFGFPRVQASLKAPSKKATQLEREVIHLTRDTNARILKLCAPGRKGYNPEAVLLDALLIAFGAGAAGRKPTVLCKGRRPPKAWIVGWVTTLIRSLDAHPWREHANLETRLQSRLNELDRGPKRGMHRERNFPRIVFDWLGTLNLRPLHKA